MKPAWPLTILLTVVLAGCNNSGLSGEPSSTTTSQEPEPTLEWVYVNRTLSVTGAYTDQPVAEWVAAPDSENCVYFQRIGKAGLASINVTADGDNPATVAAWELQAYFPGAHSYTAPSVVGKLPLALDVNATALEVEDQSELYISLYPTREPPAIAIRSPASLSIRLAVMVPDELYVQELTGTCSITGIV